MRQPGLKAKAGEQTPMRREPACLVECAQLPQIRARLAAMRDARLAQARQAAEAEAARQREAERKTRCAAQQGWLDVLRRDPDCRGG